MRTVVALIVLAGFGAGVWAQDSAGTKAGEGKKPRLTIGKETTFITEPKDKDGFIDDVEAVNERLKKGRTPNDNAKALVWQACGPHPEGRPSMPAALFARMGVAEPPEGDDYFLDSYKYAKVNLGFDPVPQAFLDDVDQ